MDWSGILHNTSLMLPLKGLNDKSGVPNQYFVLTYILMYVLKNVETLQ